MNQVAARAPMVAPYGTWSSRITAASLSEAATRLSDVVLDQDFAYWLEERPAEGGRSVVCRIDSSGVATSLTPEGYSVRSRVHEYGGGGFTVRDGVIYFVDARSQQVHRQVAGAAPQVLSASAQRRYADIEVDSIRARLLCVAEQHHAEADAEAENFIVAIDLDGDFAETVVVSGADFYAAPRLSPDATMLAYMCWNHPDMPWDGSQVMLAQLDANGLLVETKCIAGGNGESAIEPRFSAAGELWFVSDRSGFWNLHRWHHQCVVAVLEEEAEYSRAPWQFGTAQYGVLDSGQVVAVRDADGISSLVIIDTLTGVLTTLPLPYTELSQLRVGVLSAVFLAASAVDAPSLVRLDLVTGHLSVLHRSATTSLEAELVSIPEAIRFPTSGEAYAHALYYAPCNPAFVGKPDELAPLVVISHGGPTTSSSSRLNLQIQFWTSRGFAVADVNYRGSTGYGRAYREALNGGWGVIDVDDCVNAALYLAGLGRADRARMAIHGGSAGGYTTLCALAFRQVFGAGASHYGIGDLSALLRDTHKFESRYPDRLIGPYAEAEALYRQRSPLMHLEGFTSPLLLLQGLDDKVVPPNQSSTMFEALKRRGVPVAYIAFAGEGHGFRRAENIRRSFEAELYFYGKVFGFLPADALTPIDIENAETLGSAAIDA